MNKEYIIEKINSINKELNKTIIDKSYLLEKLNQIIKDIHEKEKL